MHNSSARFPLTIVIIKNCTTRFRIGEYTLATGCVGISVASQYQGTTSVSTIVAVLVDVRTSYVCTPANHDLVFLSGRRSVLVQTAARPGRKE